MTDLDPIRQHAIDAAKPWIGSPYYERAEARLYAFWADGAAALALFQRLDLTHVVELACGHGRHVPMYRERAGRITLMDILPENIAACRVRFPEIPGVVNDGTTFQPLVDESVTAIFSYDAMVHFPPDVVGSYVKDAARVLTPGGRALFHRSNYGTPFEGGYGGNPHARNHMTERLFRKLVGDQLEVEASVVIDWGGVPDLDGLTLLRKRS